MRQNSHETARIAEGKDLVPVTHETLAEITGGFWCELIQWLHPHVHPSAPAPKPVPKQASDLPVFQWQG